VHGLADVVLAVELEEQTEVELGEVDARHEDPVLVVHLDLPIELAKRGHGARQLQEKCLEQALGGRRARRTPCEDPSHATRPGHTRSAELR